MISIILLNREREKKHLHLFTIFCFFLFLFDFWFSVSISLFWFTSKNLQILNSQLSLIFFCSTNYSPNWRNQWQDGLEKQHLSARLSLNLAWWISLMLSSIEWINCDSKISLSIGKSLLTTSFMLFSCLEVKLPKLLLIIGMEMVSRLAVLLRIRLGKCLSCWTFGCYTCYAKLPTKRVTLTYGWKLILCWFV